MINFFFLAGSLDTQFIKSFSFSSRAMVDPPVYPYFDIYPAVAGRSSPLPPREEQRSTTAPTSASEALSLAPVSVKLATAYPQFNICKLASSGDLSYSIGSKTDFFRLPLSRSRCVPEFQYLSNHRRGCGEKQDHWSVSLALRFF